MLPSSWSWYVFEIAVSIVVGLSGPIVEGIETLETWTEIQTRHIWNTRTCCSELSSKPNERRAGGKVGPEEGFSMSLVGNSPAPIFRRVAHSTVCCDTR